MHSYSVEIEVNEHKISEFLEFCQSLRDRYKNEPGYRNLHLYRDRENRNNFTLYAEWGSATSLESHLRGDSFSLFKGGALVLGKNFNLITSEPGTADFSQLEHIKLIG